jgi:hypothetical protein
VEPNRKRPQLQRTALRTSRQFDYCTIKNLSAQIGHGPKDWPLALLKELVDNALDACEEARVSPEIDVVVDERGVTVSDNGPGIPAEVVAGIIDFDTRVSTRAAYCSCDRGAQGQAWKTLLLMGHVLTGETSHVEITACGVRHAIEVGVDEIAQKITIVWNQQPDPSAESGSRIFIAWPNRAQDDDSEDEDLDDWEEVTGPGGIDLSSSILWYSKSRFLQIGYYFALLNPHLSLKIEWHGKRTFIPAIDPGWKKWRACDPISAHWLTPERFQKFLAAHVTLDRQQGTDRTVREMVAQFDGLTSTAKQRLVLDATDLSRTHLSALALNGRMDSDTIGRLLTEMKRHTRPVKPTQLGFVGRRNIEARFRSLGCEMETYRYCCRSGLVDGVPWFAEVAFAWHERLDDCRLITGINWSPALNNPFRELGEYDEELGAILEEHKAGAEQPVVVLVHFVQPGVQFSDQGKSAVLLGSWVEE